MPSSPWLPAKATPTLLRPLSPMLMPVALRQTPWRSSSRRSRSWTRSLTRCVRATNRPLAQSLACLRNVTPCSPPHCPRTRQVDRRLLASLGFRVPPTEAASDDGKRLVSPSAAAAAAAAAAASEGAGQKTLFFMPHCPRRLYSNLLWSNWRPEALPALIIAGNRCEKWNPFQGAFEGCFGHRVMTCDVSSPHITTASRATRSGRWPRRRART